LKAIHPGFTKVSGLALASSLLLAGCQTYAPAGLDQGAFPGAMASRRIGDTDREWTVSDLLSVALSQNPDVLAAKARRLSAYRLADASRARPASGLSLSAEYANNAGSSPWLYGSGLDLPVDGGVRRKGRLTLADLDRLQADLEYEGAVWAVRNTLAHAIASRRAAMENLVLSQRLADIRQKRADLMDARVAAGEDARPSALLARTDLSAARRRVADALARISQANSDLAKSLGMAPSAVEAIRLAPFRSQAVESAMDPDSALRRSDVLAAMVAYDRAETDLQLEIARQFPELRIGPGYTWDHGVVKLPLNLALVLPPTDLNRANIRTAEAKREEAARNLEAIQANVLDQLGRARDNLARSRMQIALIRDRDLPAAQGLDNAARRALRAGEGDQPDALAAQAALLEVELAMAEAEGAEASAAIDLEDALRMPFAAGDGQILHTELQTGPRR